MCFNIGFLLCYSISAMKPTRRKTTFLDNIASIFSVNYNKRKSGLSDEELKIVDQKVVDKELNVDFVLSIIFIALGIFYLTLDISTGAYVKVDRLYVVLSVFSIVNLITAALLMILYRVLTNAGKIKTTKYNVPVCFVFYLMVMVTVMIFFYKDLRYVSESHEYFFSYSVFFLSLYSFSPFYYFWGWLFFFIVQLVFPCLLGFFAGANLTFWSTYQIMIIIEVLNVAGLLVRTENCRSTIDYVQKEKNNAQLKEISFKDELTKAFNRHALALDLKRLSEYKGSDSFYVIMMDIDDFKFFNDSFSHVKGDECLCLIMSSVNNIISEESLRIYRYGGEEFLIIRPGDLDSTIKLASQIRETVYKLKIDTPKDKSTHPFVSTSIGINKIQIDSHLNIESLINGVDKSLYYSKEHGKNCCSYNEKIVDPSDK